MGGARGALAVERDLRDIDFDPFRRAAPLRSR